MSVLLEAEENFGEGKPSRKWTFFVIAERFDQHHFLKGVMFSWQKKILVKVKLQESRQVLEAIGNFG